MKTVKKLLFALITIFIICTVGVSALAGSELDADLLRSSFTFGVGPEIDGYSIDYRYFSPVRENDDTKYPVVIWLHGLSDGEYEGKQLTNNNIVYWASDEYQSRFGESGGAFIFVPRSLEEKDLFWSDSLIYPLRAAIDDFIAQNKDNVDVSRIYIGGYSMGGRMTYKMAVSYPEMFAAIFPVCPAWSPDDSAAQKLTDIPVWVTSGKLDPLVSYYTMVNVGWKNITEQTNCPESCRFSTLSLTAYADGKLTSSAHHAWYAVNNDMFSSENGAYPYMKTVDGNGNTVELAYPDGMISWLMSFTSDYDGQPATDSGNEEGKGEGKPASLAAIILSWIRSVFVRLKNIFNIK